MVDTLSTDETFLVFWQDNRGGQGSDIYALRIGPNGPMGSEIIVERAIAEQLKPAVAHNGADQYLVVWEDTRNTFGPQNPPHDIYGCCVDREGRVNDQAFAICRDSGDQARPAVAFNSLTGAYLVVWQDDRGGNYDIYGVYVNVCAGPTPVFTLTPSPTTLVTRTPTRTPFSTPTRTPTPGRAKAYLSLLLSSLSRSRPTPTATPWCDPYEPNDDRRVNPWGPLVSGQSYQAKLCRGDKEDNYYLDATTAGSLQIRLQQPGALVNHTSLWVYSADDLARPLPNCGTGPIRVGDYRCTCSLPRVGRYVVRFYSEKPDVYYDDVNLYSLQVMFQ